MATLESKDGKLFIDGKPVLRGWESFSGWYWFALEEDRKQDSDFGNGRVVENDTIFYGYVQGFECEYGYFSLAELESLKGKVWEIPQRNLVHSGRRGERS